MSNEIADILERAADLIEPEGAWIQGAMACDRRGMIISPYAQAACRFCASGAVLRVIGHGKDRIKAATFAAAMEEMKVFPPAFNDAAGRTQAEVVDKLREAAAKARDSGRLPQGRDGEARLGASASQSGGSEASASPESSLNPRNQDNA